MWAAVLPADAVKTAIQAGPPGSRPGSLLETARGLAATGSGVRGLYAGLGPVLARAAPANAAQWLAWELAVRWSE
jgi:solute carrier family 25 (mitochondrial carnitine/acylcarnitine transporter), member 20/29